MSSACLAGIKVFVCAIYRRGAVNNYGPHLILCCYRSSCRGTFIHNLVDGQQNNRRSPGHVVCLLGWVHNTSNALNVGGLARAPFLVGPVNRTAGRSAR